MSMIPQQSQQSPRKKNRLLHIVLWMAIFGAVAGFIGFAFGLMVSSWLGLSAGGLFVTSQVMHEFGYINASTAISGQAVNYLYQSQDIIYVTTISFTVAGLGIGYLTGHEESEE